MKKNVIALLLVLTLLALAGCGEKSGVEGKVVDGKGKALSGVKLIAKQVEPIKGYEKFETVTGSDGAFQFKKLFPASEYEIIPWFDDWSVSPRRTLVYEANSLKAVFTQEGWISRRKMMVRSGPEGQTIILKSPVKILQTINTVSGKVVDGKGKALSGVKLIAKQVKPIKRYEKFETLTGSDGTFQFDKLHPFAKYIFIPTSKTWKTNPRKILTTTGDEEILKVSLTFRFSSANGVVSDSKTGLMWAAHDNGKEINYWYAKKYCANYKGGGYSDWRLPTPDELAKLYKAGIRYEKNQSSILSWYYFWVSGTRGDTKSAIFRFDNGNLNWVHPGPASGRRILPVRSDK